MAVVCAEICKLLLSFLRVLYYVMSLTVPSLTGRPEMNVRTFHGKPGTHVGSHVRVRMRNLRTVLMVSKTMTEFINA